MSFLLKMEFNANLIKMAFLISILYSFTCSSMQNNIQHKTAIVLSGCGFLDGTDVIEAASVIIALSKMGKTPEFIAPGNKFYKPINHQSGPPADRDAKERNVIVESARILGGVIGLSVRSVVKYTTKNVLVEIMNTMIKRWADLAGPFLHALLFKFAFRNLH